MGQKLLQQQNICMHIMKLTPNKTVAESWFKGSFVFDILNLTSWNEILYNSTHMPNTVAFVT